MTSSKRLATQRSWRSARRVGPHGGDIYARSLNGRESSWFRGSHVRHQAHISAGGVEKDGNLIGIEDANDFVDAAYDTKYGRRYPAIVPSIVAPSARAATLKLVPHQEETS